jgi:MYXO-CTERM domain-containing protein
MRALAVVLSLLPVAAIAAPHTVLYRLPSDTRPMFVAGDLSGPTTLSPEAAARAFLRAAPNLAPVDVAVLGAARLHHLTDATIVRFDLVHAGLPIVEAAVVMRLDARGAVRMVAGRPLRLENAGPPTPALSATEAQELLATTHAPGRAGLVRAVTPRLVWLPAANGGLRLVWEMRLPVVPALLEAFLLRVDANTGALVTARNLVQFADQGKVYVADPTTDGNQTTVETLADRAPASGEPPDALFNSLIKVVNCVDNHNGVPMNYGSYTVSLHVCDEVPTVVHDGSGDYVQYDPVLTPYTPTASANESASACLTLPGCDPFAEVNAYWHIMKAYRYFQAFNDPKFVNDAAMPLQVNVNYRFPIDMQVASPDLGNAIDANGKLFGADNSAFMPPGQQLLPGQDRPASVMLFEGSRTDVSYDATVAYHEFGHSVVWTTANLEWTALTDEQGLDPASMALNEGFSDLFASFISGKHVIAGYAFSFLAGAPRNLKDTHLVCPDLLWGEEHQDSQAISEALWAIHDTLGLDSEKPIFTAVAGLPSSANFDVTAAAVESALNDALGATAKDLAHGLFVDHGLIGCQRVIPYTAPRPILYSAGTSEVGVSPAPGYLQFKYTLDERAQSLHAQFSWFSTAMAVLGSSGTPAYSLYVRKDQPITWAYHGVGATAVKDYEVQLTGTYQNSAWAGDLNQVLEPGDYYLMIVNRGQGGGLLEKVTFTHAAFVETPQDDAGPPPQDDAGAPPVTGDDAGGSGVTGGSDDNGCGCRTTAPASGGLAALLVLALLLIRRRR